MRPIFEKALLMGVAGAAFALVAACGGDDTKKKTTTPGEFLKQERAKQAGKPVPAASPSGYGKTNPSVAKAPSASGPKAETPGNAAQPGGGAKPGGSKPVANKPAPPPPKPVPVAPATPTPTAPAPPRAATVRPTAMVRNATLLVRQGKYEQAIEQARTALRRNEKYVPAMIVMARAYFRLGKHEFSEAVCDIALSLEPNRGECFHFRAFTALKQGKKLAALKHFEKATQLAPRLGPAWVSLSAQYIKSKNYAAAETAARRAIRLLPNRGEAHLNLGSALRGLGKLTEAQTSYNQALRLKPRYAAAIFNLGILFLDAKAFPGQTRLQLISTSLNYFNQYKQAAPYRTKTDPVEEYISEANKAYKYEQKRIAREAKRAARNAAKAAAAAKKAAAAPKAPAPAGGGT